MTPVVRSRLLALALIAALIAGAVVLLGGGSGGGRPRTSRSAAQRARAPASRTGPPHAATPKRPATPSPGALPQTRAYPSASDARFSSLMGALWAGIVRGSLARAMPAFFPRAAYLQLKAIGSPSADWSGRLVREYRLDIAAAHALLGAAAAGARLIAVHVPTSYAHWVEPGACYNSIGYYEVPNARVLYRAGGQESSFGIASMISWRGVWYVVHLGAVLRPGEEGVVDEPATGPGTPAYSGTC